MGRSDDRLHYMCARTYKCCLCLISSQFSPAVNISLNFATIEVNEASSFVSLSMIKQGANERSVSVQLFTESGTANG